MGFSLDAVNDARRVLEQTFPKASRTLGGIEGDTGIDIVRRATPTGEPQRAYMWEVEFKSPIDGHDRDAKHIKFYAKTTAIPASINEVIKRYYAGIEYSYSGKDTSPRVFRVTFWDDQDLGVYKFFQRWYNIMQSGITRRKVSPDEYKMDVRLRLKDGSDSFTTLSFIMSNSYPSEISEAALSYSESGEITFDVMFSFSEKSMVTEQSWNPLNN